MLSAEEFQAWCARLQFSQEAESFITTIRSSPPMRRVRGRVGNVAGRYPSSKMGRTIQFESHLELGGIYLMERDEDVLEYYDQAARIPLCYRAASGRQTTQWHTPDFFVLRQGSAGFEEWKPAQALDGLAVSMPQRYQREGSGQWRCPPGEAYAERLGLWYRLRSSEEVHPYTIQNLKFLQDFWAHPVMIPAEQEELVLAQVETQPGLLLSDLLAMHPGLAVDVVWALLATGHLFADLTVVSLMKREQVALFPSEAAAQRVLSASEMTPHLQTSSPPMVWDGRLWLVESIGETIILRPEVGEPLQLPAAHFQGLLQAGAMRRVTAADPSPATPELRQALLHASPNAQHEANQRLRHLLAYARGEAIPVSTRSVQRWLAGYRAAEAHTGCGYIGLLPRVADRGSRTPRLPEATLQLLESVLKTHYATPHARGAAAVYRLYLERCTQAGIPPVSERTFYRVLASFTTPAVTSARRGRRAAYNEQPFFWCLDQTTPRHGERPLALAHLDHTELDIELVSSATGKPLGRPWATFLVDAYSRRLLVVYATYDPPSYRSAMMAVRRCVQRYGRLPQELVVDGGPEFGSVYFETLLARYFITKKERPTAQPRAGAVVERLFGTTNTEFVHTLLGNTQATKHPRQVTPEVEPKRLAVWTLERFSVRLAQWAEEVYDQSEHPALGMSPRDAFTQGMQLAGARTHRLIAYSEDFLMLTRPTTRSGRAKVDPARGITVNWLHYWHPAMRAPQVAGSTVPVRYEPFDLGVVYAFIQGQWLACVADQYAQVHGRSEREWELILDEWRAQQRAHGKQRVNVNSRLLGAFLEEVASEEQILLQRQRDLEGQPLREALAVSPPTPVPLLPPPEATPAEEEALDLATIPQYEEYV
jgi:putative transposase